MLFVIKCVKNEKRNCSVVARSPLHLRRFCCGLTDFNVKSDTWLLKKI